MLVDWPIQQPLNNYKKNLNVLWKNIVEHIIQINQRVLENFCLDYHHLELFLLKIFNNYFSQD